MAVTDKILEKSEIEINRTGKIEKIGLVLLVICCLLAGVFITPAFALFGPVLVLIRLAQLERELWVAKVQIAEALILSGIRTREISNDLLEELGLTKTPEDAKQIGEMIEDPVLVIKAGRILRDKGVFLNYDRRRDTVSTKEEN